MASERALHVVARPVPQGAPRDPRQGSEPPCLPPPPPALLGGHSPAGRWDHRAQAAQNRRHWAGKAPQARLVPAPREAPQGTAWIQGGSQPKCPPGAALCLCSVRPPLMGRLQLSAGSESEQMNEISEQGSAPLDRG